MGVVEFDGGLKNCRVRSFRKREDNLPGFFSERG